MKKVIVVFKKQDKKSNIYLFRNLKTWSTYGLPRMNRINYLKEKGINTNELLKLTPSERKIEADKLIKKVFTTNYEAAEATITALEPIRNKTMLSLFENINSFNMDGEQILTGGYNQSLRVMIELNHINVTPEIIDWDDELPFQFSNEKFHNELVVNHGITHAGNICYSLAISCRLENDILKIGDGAKFFFSGINSIKEIDFNYYFYYNGNMGKSITIPSDMDVLKFNFHNHKWQELINNGSYIKKDVVSVAKTENGNYVVMQDNPRRAIVVLENGDVVENNNAYFGNARKIISNQYSLLNYTDAIKDYEDVMRLEEERHRESVQRKMTDMYEENRGYYIVELPCFKNDFHSGGHKKKFTNWKILADSKMDAYNKAVILAEKNGYFWFDEAIKCKIDFYGIWNDEKEEILREEGLI